MRHEPRAAWRLERLGFDRVYDYVPGKMDWLSFGLGHEGTATLAADLMHRDVPTCPVEARLGDMRAVLGQEGGAYCVVIAGDGLVAGLVQGRALQQANPARTIEQVMEFGVTTVRPSEEVGPLRERMRHAGREAIPVTSSDGRLMGLLLLDEP